MKILMTWTMRLTFSIGEEEMVDAYVPPFPGGIDEVDVWPGHGSTELFREEIAALSLFQSQP